MKVLVTGAAGFIAPHVAEMFEEKGYEVVRTDIRDGDSRTLFADLSSLENMLRITEGVEIVCHLGGMANLRLALDYPDAAVRDNVLGTACLLEASLHNKVRLFIYASSSEVYGRPQYQPVNEEHLCNPYHPYTITKLCAERLVMVYSRLKGLPGVALRLGTAYGRGIGKNSVISIFIRQAMQKKPIIIEGSGHQLRQFTHVSDLARAFVLAAESEVQGEVFNILADEEISIGQLAEMVRQRLPTTIDYKEARLSDMASAMVSSAKAKEVLGWNARVGFEDGLGKLIDGFSEAG